jgi:hypothetical protein
MTFKHPRLFEEITAIGGHYTFVKEGTVTLGGRQVLYLLGIGSVDTSCCGVGGCIYALVPGYVKEGAPDGAFLDKESISLVEEVSPSDMQEILEILRQTEGVTQAVFLTEDGNARSVV